MKAQVATLVFVLICAGSLSAQIGTRAEPMVTTATATESSPACDFTGRFPLKGKTSAQTLCFWGQQGQEYLKYARFVGSEDAMTMQAEMVTDAFSNIRVTFGAAVAADTGDSTSTNPDDPSAEEAEALSLLKANGGNLSLAASYPVYYKPLGNGSYLWNSYLRLAGNVPAMGGTSDESTTSENDFNGNLELSFTEMQVDMLSFQEKFNLLGYANLGVVAGTKKFSESLGTNVGTAFLKGTLGVGMRIADQMTVYFTYNKYSDDDIPGNGGAITFVLNQ